MGYTTDFSGEFAVTPPLTKEQVAYIQAFNGSRRMKRNPEVTATLPDPKRLAVGLPIGEPDAAYYVGSADDGNFGQGTMGGGDDSIIEYNTPPGGARYSLSADQGHDHAKAQPGLWCQWTCSDDGTTLHWDGGEKFYSYVEWLKYLIEHFFDPWGRKLNGEVEWEGEDSSDFGKIKAKNSKVFVHVGRKSYGQPRKV